MKIKNFTNHRIYQRYFFSSYSYSFQMIKI